MTLVNKSPAPTVPVDAQALIEEARRHRRRRRSATVALTVVTVVTVTVVMGGGGSHMPPIVGVHYPRGGGVEAKHSSSASPLTNPNVMVITNAGLLGADLGWAYNAADLYLTTDSGERWRTITPPLLIGRDLGFISSIAAVGSEHLWVAASDLIGVVPAGQSTDGSIRGDGIERSGDGGVTWSFTSLPGCLQGCGGDLSLSFVDALHGFVTIGPDSAMHTRLFSTSDGGATWQTFSTLSFASWGAKILFTNRFDGWALLVHPGPPGGALYRTTDGGETWHEAPGLPSGDEYQIPTFFGSQDGVVLAFEPSPVVFVTENGGATWVTRPVPIRCVLTNSRICRRRPFTMVLICRSCFFRDGN